MESFDVSRHRCLYDLLSLWAFVSLALAPRKKLLFAQGDGSACRRAIVELALGIVEWLRPWLESSESSQALLSIWGEKRLDRLARRRLERDGNEAVNITGQI